MEFPASVYRAVQAAVEAHPEDLQQALAAAESNVRAIPDYNALVDSLVRQAVQTLVYQRRHEINRVIKREAGSYGTPARVRPGATAAVAEVYQAVYLYNLGGRILGNLSKEDLLPIAEQEESAANGHLFNSRLCRKLHSVLKNTGDVVREKITPNRLCAIFLELGQAPPKDGAA